jgi:alginate O-acetyltransferase complex protein AlgI
VQFFLTVSGYGEMAKGIALCYGFSLPDDYENPLFSGSLSAFGQRWNRSVVGCSAACFSLLLRTQKWQSVLGNMLTWGLLGIWYRPSLHMLVCGLWMGFWIGMDQYLRNKMQKIPALVDAIAFFLVFCCGGAVFSAPSLLEGGVRIGLLFGSSGMIVQDSDWYVVQSGSVILLLALYCASGHFTKWVEKLQQKAVPARMLHVLELPVQLLLLALSLLGLSVA